MKKKKLSTYAKLCAQFYDLEQHPHHDEALDFYLRHAIQANGPILEPMCGTGRFTIPLLQAGLDVCGFDASPSMIELFRKKYAPIQTGPAPVWQQFVQDFSSNPIYHMIFIPYGSWGLITDLAKAQKGLANLYKALAPGGKLFIEIETVCSGPQLCGVPRRGARMRHDGAILELNFIASYDSQTQIFKSDVCYELVVGNRVQEREHELFMQYLYHADEFEKLLMQAGFLHIKKYPAFECMQEVDAETPTIVYECSK